jgi:glucosamine--fructose-6-phosphate aminotransferase (isomerizing)
MHDMLARLKELKAETLIFTDRGHKEAIEMNPRAVAVPGKLKELYTPIPYIIPAQLFTAFLAVQKGLDPDRPRTLSKVTRTM